MAYNIKKRGYVKIGYEKAKEQLEDYFKQEMDKLKPDEPEIINYDDDYIQDIDNPNIFRSKSNPNTAYITI